MKDWKLDHANQSADAWEHKIVQDVIEEQMFNLNTKNELVRLGLTKIAMYAAQVARAQALGFDPDLLRLSPEEVTEGQLKLIEIALQHGKQVTVIRK